MKKMILTGLKLWFYLGREGIGGLTGRVKRSLDRKEMTYDRYKKKHHLDRRSLKAMKEWQDAQNIKIHGLCFGHVGVHSFKSLSGQQSEVFQMYQAGKMTFGFFDEDDYVLLLGEDVNFSKDALFELTQYVMAHPETEVLYADHDIRGEEPVFKPDYNRVLQLTTGYIGEVVLVKGSLLEKVLLAPDSDIDIKNYEAVVAAVIAGADVIGHVPKILYRVSEAQADYKQVIFDDVPDQMISIVIPNHNHLEDLKKCLNSIWRQNYQKLQIIIVENGSDDQELFAYYETIQAEHDNVLVVTWDKDFNYPAVNNFGVSYATGDYILLLNNDVELMGEEVFKEMLGWCSEETVGAVGIKLLYPDETIQHAGVVVGYGGIAGHAFLGCPKDHQSYMNRMNAAQNYSAVTAACMMVKKDIYDRLGGFDERYQIAWNDIDFCLRLGELGYEIVYTPHASAWHYESKSRGAEDTIRKMIRYNSEVSMFRNRWMDMIKHGDPAYNPNLSLYSWDFRIG